ncbi:MAG: hypothetical protein PHY48_16900 [Candidatus Cloacimonetes bacterium]|jgi:hypothetical protein|nr:hypothetical protein [Candidatus Cloacimonadota bacterium]
MFSYKTKPRYLTLIFVLLCSSIFSQVPPVIPGTTALNDLFADSGLPTSEPFPLPPQAPLSEWAAAGSNAVVDSLLEIDITNIEPIVSLVPSSTIIDTTYFVSATPNDDLDDSDVFKKLIDFLVLRELNILEYIRINIPPGIYNFSDQIVMHSNISIKGAGSNLTELRFLIRADSTSTTMSES